MPSFLSFISILEVFLPCFSKGKPKDQRPLEAGEGDLENTEMAWLST